jgi:hypothetical protein
MIKRSSIPAIAALGAAIVIGAGVLSACAPATQQSGPDPEPVKLQNPKIIGAYRLPEGFRNVIEWCDNAGNSLGVTSRGSDLAGGQNGGGLASAGWLIMVKDPRCLS